MKLSMFKFNLPKDLIAAYPSKNRDDARLMVVDRASGKILHKKFKNRIVSVYKSLPNYCEQGIVITGDLGGQIFGERSQVSIDSTFDNWKDFFFKKYKNVLNSVQ